MRILFSFIFLAYYVMINLICIPYEILEINNRIRQEMKCYIIMSCKEVILKKFFKIISIVITLGMVIFLSTVLLQENQDFEKQKISGIKDEIHISLTESNVNTDDIDTSANQMIRDESKVSNKEIAQDEDAAVEVEEKETNKDKDTTNEVANKETEEEEDTTVEAALNIINPSLEVDATSAVLLDCSTGKVLYHKNGMKTVYPASTTKLMTALVALDLCDVSDEVTIGSEIGFMAIDSSRAYLAEGQRLTVQMLLEGMLVPSGNDAAYAIAAYAGRVSLKDKKADAKEAVNEFVRLMNEKVAELGLENTNFKNPDGYDEEGQYTTAYDMGIIAMEVINNKTIRNIAGKSHARNVFLSGEDVTWKSSNKLIVSGSGMYYKYAIGLKTGSSSLAGRCLVSAAEENQSTYVSVVMNSTLAGRWEDSIELLEYGLEYNQ